MRLFFELPILICLPRHAFEIIFLTTGHFSGSVKLQQFYTLSDSSLTRGAIELNSQLKMPSMSSSVKEPDCSVLDGLIQTSDGSGWYCDAVDCRCSATPERLYQEGLDSSTKLGHKVCWGAQNAPTALKPLSLFLVCITCLTVGWKKKWKLLFYPNDLVVIVSPYTTFLFFLSGFSPPMLHQNSGFLLKDPLPCCLCL